MIVKSFELDKINCRKNFFFLFYGANQGHKNKIIDEKFKVNFSESTYYYDENDILLNENNFFMNKFDLQNHTKVFQFILLT